MKRSIVSSTSDHHAKSRKTIHFAVATRTQIDGSTSMRKLERSIQNLILVCIFLISGCATTKIDSIKSADYSGTPHSIWILAVLGSEFDSTFLQISGDQKVSFKQEVTNTLHSCGVSSEVELLDKSTPRITFNAALAHDSFLKIQAVASSSGGPAAITGYHLELTDSASKAVVWQADIVLRKPSGPLSHSDLGELLAKTIIDQMVQDKILPPACLIIKPRAHTGSF